MRVAHRTNDPGAFDQVLDRTRKAGCMVRLLGRLADRVGDDGLLAIAHALLRRTRSAGGDLDRAVAEMAGDLRVATPLRLPDGATLTRCTRAAVQALAGAGTDPAVGANRLHGTDWMPVWARHAVPITRIGPFAFYHLDEE